MLGDKLLEPRDTGLELIIVEALRARELAVAGVDHTDATVGHMEAVGIDVFSRRSVFTLAERGTETPAVAIEFLFLRHTADELKRTLATLAPTEQFPALAPRTFTGEYLFRRPVQVDVLVVVVIQAVEAVAVADHGGIAVFPFTPLERIEHLHADIADIYFDLGSYDEAIDEYRKAVDLGRNFADLHTKLAIAYRERGEFERALEEFQEALEHNASYIAAYILLGVTYYMHGDMDRAVEVWEAALEADPEAKAVKVYLEFVKDRAAQ